MIASSNAQNGWQKTGILARVLIGSFIVLCFAYAEAVWVSTTAFSTFWPFAGLWAAVGWGASRLSVVPVIALLVLGVVADLLAGAPLGCWPSIYLVPYLVSSVFRKRAQTDRTGAIRILGDVVSFVIAFLFARWLIGSYLGGVDTREIIGGFLSAALFYFPVRALFRLSSDDRVDT